MNEAALQSQIDCLQQNLGQLESTLYFWILLVILGCAGELFFVIYDYVEERKIWFRARTRGAIAFPEKPSIRVLVLEVLSVAAVVIGISGELHVDRESNALQTELRKANNSLFLLLDTEAGNAKTSAEGAARSASTAKQASDSAVRKSEQAENEAATASNKSSEAAAISNDALNTAKEVREQAEAAKKDIQTAKKLADEALTRTKPRAIPPSMIASLTGKPKSKLEILYKVDDEECYLFAIQLQHALGSAGAGWEVAPPKPVTDKDVLASPNDDPSAPLTVRAGALIGGLAIVVKTKQNPQDMVSGKSPAGALMQATGAMVIAYNRNMPADLIRLIVGPRMF